MQEEYAIEVKNITKNFKVYLDKGNTMKEKILFKKRRRYEERKFCRGFLLKLEKERQLDWWVTMAAEKVLH